MKNFTLFLFFIIFFGIAYDVESATRYKVTPRVIDKEVSARDIFTEFITIENLSPHKIDVYPTVNEITVDGGGDIAEFVPASMEKNKAESITTWISLSRSGQELLPGETIELPLSFRIHKDTPSGAYQAFIGFGTGRNRDIAEKQVLEGQAPGVIVTLAVDQNQTEFIKLDKFSVERFILEPNNNGIQYILKNPGDTSVVPTGEVIFYNGRGDEVGAINVNPDNVSLVPGQETIFSANAPMAGLLGKYKAFLSVDYGSEQIASVYDTAYFYVMPWHKLLAIFGTVMVLAVILTVMLHRRMQVAGGTITEEVSKLRVHVYEGTSPEQKHDINLKK